MVLVHAAITTSTVVATAASVLFASGARSPDQTTL